MEPGMYVQLDVGSRPEYNSKVWQVQGPASDRPYRLLVRSADDSTLTISVRREAVAPLAILPATIHVGERVAFDPLEESVYHAFGDGERGGGGHGFTNRSFTRVGEWIPLPGLGGNCLQIVPNPHAGSLVMFPELAGYDLWFYSAWSEETILLMQYDVLKRCPQWQYWPWCSYCQRFLFPPEAHRAGARHDGAARWVHSGCTNDLREMILGRL